MIKLFIKYFSIGTLYFVLGTIPFSCKEANEEINAADYSCKALPAFIKSTGLNPARSAFSTSETHTMGLVLKEFPLPNANAQPKIYQHPSWKIGGWLSPIQIDNMGNVFTAPAPFINVYNNPAQNSNTIYKVNNTSGVMEEFMRLPITDSLSYRNPYGILSIAFNCKKNILYVSSVAGSTPQKENGCLYAIDIASKKIIDKISGKDFFGIQLVVANDQLQLLAGSTRNSNIYQLKIKKDGSFTGSPSIAASIEGLGARGDDKVKKIIFKSDGNIQIKGLEFNYNLIAPTEKQESNYGFYFDTETKKWQYKE